MLITRQKLRKIYISYCVLKTTQYAKINSMW